MRGETIGDIERHGCEEMLIFGWNRCELDVQKCFRFDEVG